MIECPHCEKRHRDEEAVEKCKARKERREAREQAKKDDAKRRWKNLEDLPVEDLIAEEMRKGQSFDYRTGLYGPMHWERIVASLNRDYPPPPHGKWTIWDVVRIDSIQLMRTWGMPLEKITELRLEKHMLGDFVTDHPLRERSA